MCCCSNRHKASLRGECKSELPIDASDDSGRQISACDVVALGKNHRVLDYIIELAYITFPGQGHQDIEGIVDTLEILAQLGIVSLYKNIDQKRNVL